MCYCKCDLSVDNPKIIRGRPDFSQPRFGYTIAKNYPDFAYSLRTGAALIHRILRVELHWYEAHFDHLLRLDSPHATAITVCQFYIALRKDRGMLCALPKPGAVMCGRCLGGPATFPRNRAGVEIISRHDAHEKLGCVMEGQ